MSNLTVEERFWKYVQKTDTCWLWTAAKNKDGYGRFSVAKQVIYTHRYSYELHKGAIPGSFCVLHTCDTPSCVNPAHLFTGTQSDNAIDKGKKGRGNSPRGEKSGRSKLADSAIPGIFKDFKRGLTKQAIANKHGVSPGQIGKILSGENRQYT